MSLLFVVGGASALLVPTPTLSAGSSSSSVGGVATSSRRALLNGVASFSAAVSASALLPGNAEATDFFKKQEGTYMTMEAYNNVKAEAKKDEKLFGTFEALRFKAGNTAEFDKLASEDKLKDVSALALKWDQDIRKELMDKAAEQLDAKTKDSGSAISKAMLEDLKQLDKLAKAGDKDGIPAVSAAVRSKVLQFVELEPQRLIDRYGVGDL